MPPKRRSAKKYGDKNIKEHIRDVPDTYLGSILPENVKEYVFDFETGMMKQVEMDLPTGVKRVFLEILSNAGDNVLFSVAEGVDPGPIEFSFDANNYLSIRNGGISIPVEPHETSTAKELYLLPTNLFSKPLSSSNYDEDKDRLGAGRNGFGSKLTNTYSTHFIVTIGDVGGVDEDGETISGQEYYGEWKDNMETLVKAEASPGFKFKGGEWVRIKKNSYKGPSFVEVSWLLDFKRMSMPNGGYSKNDIGLFSRYVLGYSFACNIPVKINGTLYDFRSVRKFASLFFEKDTVKSGISFFFPGKDAKVPQQFLSAKTTMQKENIVVDGKYEPESQILLLDTPDNGQIFSYANGLQTFEGGVHVEKLYRELTPLIIKAMNDKTKNSNNSILKPKDIKSHVTAFISCRLFNTKYGSQSKTKLTNPTPYIVLNQDDVKNMMLPPWFLSERLLNATSAKSLKSLSKTDGKKAAYVSLDKGEDANYAGKSNSAECRLYIVEGKSAASYPMKRIQLEKGAKDYGGYYPIQGKPMNVSSQNNDKIAKNRELETIKKIIGLHQGVDYSLAENFKTLRYGQVILTTDADSDGMHILGLIINLFHKYWPSLLESGYVRYLATPVVRAYVGKGKKEEVICFYDEKSFQDWNRKNKNLKCEIKYFKGLGSSDDADIEKDIQTAPVVILDYDDNGRDLVDLAFLKDRSDDRKEWIKHWREIRDETEPFKPTSNLIQRKVSDVMGISFPPYMIDNLFRAIPSFKDGLKKSQRQVMAFALHQWNYGNSYKESERIGMKVDDIATKTSGHVNYHHGVDSLKEAVIKMTQDFTGSNNLPLFRKHGQFGSRNEGGKDAASSRYINVSCPWWMSYLYQKDMVELIETREVDGEKGEPIWLPCDLPLGVINGCRGVGTGWSTYIPSHHPLQVTDWIIKKLSGGAKPSPLIPYFKGFMGKTLIKTKLSSKKSGSVCESANAENDQEEVSDDTSEIFADYCGRGLTTVGSYEMIKNNSDGTVDVRVTEIPVYVWLKVYLSEIEKLRVDGKIKGYKDNGTLKTPNLTIYSLPIAMSSNEKLGLEKSSGLTNMVLINDDGVPQLYRSVEQIVDIYVETMTDMYSKLKESKIRALIKKMSVLQMERKIIIAYIDKKFTIEHKTDDELDENLKQLELSPEIFSTINLRSLTKTQIDILTKKINEREQELKILQSTPVQRMWIDRLHAFRKEFVRRDSSSVSFDKTFDISSSIIGNSNGNNVYKRLEVSYTN